MPKLSRHELSTAEIKSASRPGILFDSRQHGLGLRVTGSGAKSWVIHYRHKGKLRWLTIGSYPTIGLSEARTRAGEELAKVSRGIDVAALKQAERAAVKATAAAITFGELASQYQQAKAALKSWRDNQQRLNHDMLPVWGERKAADISIDDVAVLVGEIARRAPIQSNRVLALISSIYEWGSHPQQHLVPGNPARGVKRQKEQPRDRVLSPGEIKRLWLALEPEDPRLAAFYRLALLTGQREGELAGATWSEFQLSDVGAVWSLAGSRTKNGRPHTVPLGPSALAILRELRAAAAPDARYLFDAVVETQDAYMRRHNLRICDRAKIENFRFHDLRRVCASGIAELCGADVTSRILNHSKSGVTARHYDRYSYLPEMRRALERWDARVAEIVGVKTTTGSNVVQFPSAGATAEA